MRLHPIPGWSPTKDTLPSYVASVARFLWVLPALECRGLSRWTSYILLSIFFPSRFLRSDVPNRAIVVAYIRGTGRTALHTKAELATRYWSPSGSPVNLAIMKDKRAMNPPAQDLVTTGRQPANPCPRKPSPPGNTQLPPHHQRSDRPMDGTAPTKKRPQQSRSLLTSLACPVLLCATGRIRGS